MSKEAKPRITRSVKRKHGKPRAFKLIVPVAGEIEIAEGIDRGRLADVIIAPAGTIVQPRHPDATS